MPATDLQPAFAFKVEVDGFASAAFARDRSGVRLCSAEVTDKRGLFRRGGLK